MSNYALLSDGRLGNQLSRLYGVYATYDTIDKLYFPHFLKYSHNFKCDKLCSDSDFNNNRGNFIEIDWSSHGLIDPDNFLSERFSDLFLNNSSQRMVNEMVDELPNGDLIAVHMRHGDYKEWCNGEQYFTKDQYIEKLIATIENCGISNPSVVIFSDDKQDTGYTFSWEITNGDPVIDMYLMSYFNYFISSHSTFSGIAIQLAKSRGNFISNFQMG
jgi:hypothetical protein